MVKTHTCKWMTHKCEDNHNCREVRYLSPTLGYPALGSCARKTSPQNVWLWRPLELIFGRARGLWQINSPFLKGTLKISHTLGPRAEAVIWKEPRSDTLANLGETPREKGGNWSSPGDMDTGGSHSGELFYQVDTVVSKHHFGNFPQPY